MIGLVRKLRLPRALDSVLKSLLRQRQGDSDYGIVNAFVDVLTTLKPTCDAVADARWFGNKAGVPLERLPTRQDLLVWLQEGPSTRSGSPQEPVSAGTGMSDTAPLYESAATGPLDAKEF